MKRPMRYCVLLAVLVSAVLAAPPAGAGASHDEQRLVILYTHDLHSYFLPQRQEQPDGSFAMIGGFARLASAIEEERHRHGTAVLLVDAGDYSMGTLFHTAFMAESYELRLMAAMGYDAVTLGNHEYDFEPWGLAASLATARKHLDDPPALVASNVVFTEDDPRDQPLKEEFFRYPVQEYLVVEKNGIRVGIFGILGEKAMVDAPFARPVTFSDPVEQSRMMIDILRNRERVDLVVCLSHTGTSPVPKHSEDELIAREAPGIDVLVSGHTHTVLETPIMVGDTHIVSAGNYGSYLGVLKMAVPSEGAPRMLSSELRKITEDIPEHEELAETIQTIKAQIEADVLEPLGLGFDQVVAMTDFSTETLAYAAEHPGELGLGNLIGDSYRFAIRQAEGSRYDHVHLAIQPIGHIRDSIRRGPVTVADVFRVLSLGIGPDGTAGYPLITGYLTGRELRKLMEVETTVSRMKTGAQLQVSGVQMTYNPHRLPFDRVTSLAVQDERGAFVPVDRSGLYRIAANLYTAYMVDYISHVSHGLLSMELKDRDGKPLKHMTDGIVRAGAPDGDNGEVKEWLALIAYLQSFDDRSGDGLPDIPRRYAGPEGRIVAEPSLNPVSLVRGGTLITWGAVAILAIIVAIPTVLVVWFRRRRINP